MVAACGKEVTDLSDFHGAIELGSCLELGSGVGSILRIGIFRDLWNSIINKGKLGKTEETEQFLFVP